MGVFSFTLRIFYGHMIQLFVGQSMLITELSSQLSSQCYQQSEPVPREESIDKKD